MRIFKKKLPLTPFQAAVKDGRLIDMQVEPYAEFNRFLGVSCSLWMTRAAFKEVVTVPHERGHLRIQKAARWAMVLANFHNVSREGDPTELVYDVYIHRLSGFHQYKPIKVASVETEKDCGLLWLLPNEEPPLAVDDSDCSRE